MGISRREVLSGMAGGALAAALPGGSRAFAAEEVLRYAHQLPITDNLHKAAVAYGEGLAELSGGDLELEIYPAAQLLDDTETVEGVINGITDIGSCNTAQWVGIIPGISAHELPFIFPDIAAVKEAFQGEYGNYIDAKMEQNGAKRLMYLVYGFVDFASRDEVLKSPSDFSGKKVRVYSRLTSNVVSALGGAPVTVPGAEQYMALQRGVVDASTTNTAAMVSRKYSEVANSVTVTYYSVTVHAAAMNINRWNSLSTDTQQTVLDAAERAQEWMFKTTAEEIQSNLNVLAKEGMEVYHLTEEQRQQFVEATQPVIQAYLEENGEVGQKLLSYLGVRGPVKNVSERNG